MERSRSYNEGIRNRGNTEQEVPEKKSLREVFLEDNNIQKIINYDDKKLSLTREQLPDTIINKRVARVDNFYRIFLPLLFFVLIIVIMSYEK